MGVRIFGIASSTNSAEDFRLAASGLFVPASQINNRTGVTSVPVLTGTGSFTCTVGPFSCVVDGTSNSLQGSYWATLDTATTVTINAASTQNRIDLISLQIQDNAYDGSGFQRGQVLYTAGTPGSGVAPSTPANAIALFNVPVVANASSVVFGNATAVYPYTAAAGGIIPVRSSADKPAVVAGAQYRHRADVTATAGGVTPLESSVDGVTYTPVFDPGAFAPTAFATTWTGSTTNPVLNNGTLTMRYSKISKLVTVRVALTVGSTTTLGAGFWSFSLPFTAANANGVCGTAYANVTGSGAFYGAAFAGVTTGTCYATFGLSNTAAGAASPGSWAAGDVFVLNFAYESAS